MVVAVKLNEMKVSLGFFYFSKGGPAVRRGIPCEARRRRAKRFYMRLLDFMRRAKRL